MTPSEQAEEILTMLQAILSRNETDGMMITGFALVVAGIDSNGEKAAWLRTNPGATAWETSGLLKFALNEEAAYRNAFIFRHFD